MTKKQALENIEKLAERFDYHIEHYKKGGYNETQTRNDYINPFFEALGWDINNRAGLAESYREVIHEDKIKVAGKTKAPDYCFTIYGQKKFFLEAKKPSVSIKDAIEPAYQLRRYGWSAKMPISIISDFEEFSIYDCTIKPAPTDKAAVSRIKYFTYKDYLKEFDFLWETFSKEMVLKGSFDRFVSSNKGKKGTTGVDAEFLKSLDTWRDLLARNIVNRNHTIDEDELNYSLQKIMDRIIFLRICEDRGVESENQLFNLIGNNSYEKLKTLFHTADLKYNSGLFDYQKDRITDNLKIDDKTLKTIIEEMYYPKSPYEFSVIPVEILGHSYEQYLGKIIRITPGHRIKIEEKPEVRKAGGVYYTPQYIVDYIVKNTVGKLFEGKTPEDVAKIKICDPACGSGSFLLGAYQYILDWHKEYYHNSNIKNKDKFLRPDGNLTTKVKKEILLNNIYGVDIDTNAVEVTKLSLMLKAMEGETEASISQLSFLHERVLPSLDSNIKSGNSLIDIDFYDNQMDFEPGAEKKIKPFNWESAFPMVFKQGGFDVVIGNPPWVSLSGKFGNEIMNKGTLNYLISKYQSNTYMPNLYEYFVYKGLDLISKTGLYSYIVPDRLGFNSQFINLRNRILLNYSIEELIYKVPFPGIVTDTLMFRISRKNDSSKDNQFHVGEYGKTLQTKSPKEYLEDLNKTFYYESSDSANDIIKKIFENSKCLSLSFIADSTSGFGGNSKKITQERESENQIKVLRGRSINRYSINQIYYFQFIKSNITGRTTDKHKLGFKEKVLLRKTGYPMIATYDDSGIFPEQSLYFLFNVKLNLSFKYLTGLINSKLFQFVYINSLVTNKDSTPQLKKIDLDKFPVYTFDFTNENDKTKHEKFVNYVDNMLQLNKDLQAATLPEQKEHLQARIKYTDNKIDQLVYQLYELTEEEIKIVEGEG